MNDETLRRLAADVEIRNLLAHLFHLADFSDELEEYLSLFTEDVIWERVGEKQGKTIGPHVGGRVVGREAIRADRVKVRGEGFQGPGSGAFHVITTIAVRVLDDKTAEAESYFLLVVSGSNTFVRSIGRYQDSFRHEGGGWKISHRRFTLDRTPLEPS